MATAADFLAIPPGWSVVAARTVADIRSIDPNATVECDWSQDFYAVSVLGLGDVVGNVPTVAQQLDQAAQQYGSRVYMLALIHKVDFDFLGVKIDRYRWAIVHNQFPVLVALIALPILISIVGVWLECQGQPLDQCGQQLQTSAKDAAQAMCNIFGAGCALQALGTILIATSAVTIGVAGLLFFLESGIASRMGLKGPRLPAIPAPQVPQAPRISVTAGTPVGLPVSLRTGTSRRRGGGGRGLAA